MAFVLGFDKGALIGVCYTSAAQYNISALCIQVLVEADVDAAS